jgi:hypothetical protein
MTKKRLTSRQLSCLIFLCIFSFSLATGAALPMAVSASATTETPTPTPGADIAPVQAQINSTYAGSQMCANCHKQIHEPWMTTRHAQAFSSPIFQRDWSNLAKQTSCLECHTTGFNAITGAYVEAGVACEACHGPFQPNHPAQKMPVKPNSELCGACHKSTVDEWKASKHSAAGIVCEDCHDPHSQTPKAESITGLCSNCHKDRGASFTHGTHATSGLQCSNCHMYTQPREGDPIMGLVATGHTFSVGSDGCVGCHQDTVHSRNEIIKLTGEVDQTKVDKTADMQQTILQQEDTIKGLEASGTVRLYTGLAQGAMVGLVTGGVAAWVVSKRIKFVEENEDD